MIEKIIDRMTPLDDKISFNRESEINMKPIITKAIRIKTPSIYKDFLKRINA